MQESTQVHPSLAVRKESLYEGLIYAFLFTGYLNTVLRASPESDITVFRLLLPLAFIFCGSVFKSTMIRCGLFIMLFLVYGVINSMAWSFGKFNVVFFLHYSTLIFLAMLTYACILRFRVQSLVSHLRTVYIVMIVVAFLQFIYKFGLPNTFYRNTLNIYYWVENDFSAALAAFIPFLLVAPRKRGMNLVLALVGFVIIVFNDSRIALLAIVFFVIFNFLNRFDWSGYLVLAIVVIFLFVLFREYKLGGNSLYQLLIDPFGRIFTLTPYEQYGSVYDRTNALIFGIKELIGSWGFGIGPGNVTAMFKLPEYSLKTAQSMHNFIAQFVVEYGWLVVFILIYGLLQSYNLRRRLNISAKKDRLLYVYFAAMALASLSQSEGLFSNYFFFICLFTSVAYFGNANIGNRNDLDVNPQNLDDKSSPN